MKYAQAKEVVSADLGPSDRRVIQLEHPRVEGFKNMPARSIAAALSLMLTSVSWAGEHCRAIDGDTLRCGRERVRLLNVYAAELHEPGGQAARVRLQRRLDGGDVMIDRRGYDRYGRTLGHVYVNRSRVTQADVGLRGGRGSSPRR